MSSALVIRVCRDLSRISPHPLGQSFYPGRQQSPREEQALLSTQGWERLSRGMWVDREPGPRNLRMWVHVGCVGSNPGCPQVSAWNIEPGWAPYNHSSKQQ